MIIRQILVDAPTTINENGGMSKGPISMTVHCNDDGEPFFINIWGQMYITPAIGFEDKKND